MMLNARRRVQVPKHFVHEPLDGNSLTCATGSWRDLSSQGDTRVRGRVVRKIVEVRLKQRIGD